MYISGRWSKKSQNLVNIVCERPLRWLVIYDKMYAFMTRILTDNGNLEEFQKNSEAMSKPSIFSGRKWRKIRKEMAYANNLNINEFISYVHRW